MKNNNDIFWEFIKNCGKDCENINETRKIYKKNMVKKLLILLIKNTINTIIIFKLKLTLY